MVGYSKIYCVAEFSNSTYSFNRFNIHKRMIWFWFYKMYQWNGCCELKCSFMCTRILAGNVNFFRHCVNRFAFKLSCHLLLTDSEYLILEFYDWGYLSS